MDCATFRVTVSDNHHSQVPLGYVRSLLGVRIVALATESRTGARAYHHDSLVTVQWLLPVQPRLVTEAVRAAAADQLN